MHANTHAHTHTLTKAKHMLGMYSRIETVAQWHLSLSLYLKNYRKRGFSSGSCFIQDDDEIIVSIVCFLRDRVHEYLFHSDNAELQ